MDTLLKAGDKVTLDHDVLTGDANFEERREAYKQFVQDNKDKVLTVTAHPFSGTKNQQAIVSFEEDTTIPKWLFWHGYCRKLPNQILFATSEGDETASNLTNTSKGE